VHAHITGTSALQITPTLSISRPLYFVVRPNLFATWCQYTAPVMHHHARCASASVLQNTPLLLALFLWCKGSRVASRSKLVFWPAPLMPVLPFVSSVENTRVRETPPQVGFIWRGCGGAAPGIRPAYNLEERGRESNYRVAEDQRKQSNSCEHTCARYAITSGLHVAGVRGRRPWNQYCLLFRGRERARRE
jgi:hypothetical protein